MNTQKSSDWFSPQYTHSESKEIDYQTAEINKCMCLISGRPELDYYKVLRARVDQVMRKNDWNTLMITSVHPGEGKTLTAVNLAVTFAKEFSQTVLLVDADLQQQDIHRKMGYSKPESLVEYLRDNRPLSEIMVWPQIEKLTVISGETTVVDSSEILGSPRMGELVTDMKTRYDNRYILFDTPAVLNKADAIQFAPLVDGILVVVQSGRTKPQEIAKAVAMLPKEKLAGFVLNRMV